MVNPRSLREQDNVEKAKNMTWRKGLWWPIAKWPAPGSPKEKQLEADIANYVEVTEYGRVWLRDGRQALDETPPGKKDKSVPGMKKDKSPPPAMKKDKAEPRHDRLVDDDDLAMKKAPMKKKPAAKPEKDSGGAKDMDVDMDEL